MSRRGLPKTVKTARSNHHCWKCGELIKKGDRFTMGMDWGSGSLIFRPICLRCVDKGYDKEHGQDESGI